MMRRFVMAKAVMCRNFLCCSLLGIVFVTAIPSLVYAGAQERAPLPQFFSTLKDVPLMDGLFEMPEHDVVFDKPQGQIVEVSARMDGVSHDDVMAFYDVALPQFGWRKTPKGIFFRRNEFLEISFERNNKERIVKFMIRPTL